MAEVKSLLVDGSEFDTGEVEFEVRNGETIVFNPTDPFMLERIYRATQALENRQNEYQQKAKTFAEGSDEFFDFQNTVNEEMMETLSSIFTHGMPNNVFGGIGAYAFNKSGVQLWVAFIDAVMNRMDVSVRKAQSEHTARIEKLLSKYKKR